MVWMYGIMLLRKAVMKAVERLNSHSLAPLEIWIVADIDAIALSFRESPNRNYSPRLRVDECSFVWQPKGLGGPTETVERVGVVQDFDLSPFRTIRIRLLLSRSSSFHQGFNGATETVVLAVRYSPNDTPNVIFHRIRSQDREARRQHGSGFRVVWARGIQPLLGYQADLSLLCGRVAVFTGHFEKMMMVVDERAPFGSSTYIISSGQPVSAPSALDDQAMRGSAGENAKRGEAVWIFD
ncbi:hypothetical protein B0H13DRAFT_1888713 [Mycena leptocephala]|nr:hypothetical protein B0H13DRAFT_1888713 [Mycena leptocephala]